MIPGEPLLCSPRRPLRLPGVPQRPRRLRLRHVFVACLGVAFVWWLAATVFRPITDDTCIGLPEASYPALDYRGYDGAWIYMGHIIGYSDQEDDNCLSLNPIG